MSSLPGNPAELAGGGGGQGNLFGSGALGQLFQSFGTEGGGGFSDVAGGVSSLGSGVASDAPDIFASLDFRGKSPINKPKTETTD